MYIWPSLGVFLWIGLLCITCLEILTGKTQIFEGLTHKREDWDHISMVFRDYHHAIVQLPNQYAFKLILKKLVEIKGMNYTRTTTGSQHRNLS